MPSNDVIADRGSTFPAGIEVERHHDPDSGADTMTINMGPSHPRARWRKCRPLHSAYRLSPYGH